MSPPSPSQPVFQASGTNKTLYTTIPGCHPSVPATVWLRASLPTVGLPLPIFSHSGS